MSSVAIVGYGFVGKSMHRLFPDAVIYSPGVTKQRFWLPYQEDMSPSALEAWEAEKELDQDDVNKCDVAFVCVPTPNRPDGSLDTSIVEEVVAWCECPLIVIRSTVNPGTADYLEKTYGRNIVVMPEYIGETVAHPLLDEKARSFLIIGGQPSNRRRAIELFQTVYSAHISIRQMSNLTAEVVKLSENRAIAFKLAQCQELYDACEAAGIDYYIIRDAVYGDDPRFNLWHTFIYPEKRGMQSKCLPKDVYAWAAWAESLGASASITRSILERNEEWVKQRKD